VGEADCIPVDHWAAMLVEAKSHKYMATAKRQTWICVVAVAGTSNHPPYSGNIFMYAQHGRTRYNLCC
jgi:hypothetical protein